MNSKGSYLRNSYVILSGHFSPPFTVKALRWDDVWCLVLWFSVKCLSCWGYAEIKALAAMCGQQEQTSSEVWASVFQMFWGFCCYQFITVNKSFRCVSTDWFLINNLDRFYARLFSDWLFQLQHSSASLPSFMKLFFLFCPLFLQHVFICIRCSTDSRPTRR